MGIIIKAFLFIVFTLVMLFIFAFLVSDYQGDTKVMNKELDEAKQEEQQALKEVKQQYDKCRELNDKSECDAIVENNPKADEIIHD